MLTDGLSMLFFLKCTRKKPLVFYSEMVLLIYCCIVNILLLYIHQAEIIV